MAVETLLREWLADIVRQRCEELGISHAELARRIGYDVPNNIRVVLRCAKDIPVPRIPAWRAALELEGEAAETFTAVAACSRIRDADLALLMKKLINGQKRANELHAELSHVEERYAQLQEQFRALQSLVMSVLSGDRPEGLDQGSHLLSQPGDVDGDTSGSQSGPI